MPTSNAYLGATVLYFPHGDLGREPEVAIVTKVNLQNTIDVWRVPPRGGFRSQVHSHAGGVLRFDDDRLKVDADAKLMGAWKWPEDYRDELAAAAELKAARDRQASRDKKVRDAAITRQIKKDAYRDRVMELINAGKKPWEAARNLQIAKPMVEEIVAEAKETVTA